MDTETDDMGTDPNCIGCRFWICDIDHDEDEATREVSCARQV